MPRIPCRLTQTPPPKAQRRRTYRSAAAGVLCLAVGAVLSVSGRDASGASRPPTSRAPATALRSHACGHRRAVCSSLRVPRDWGQPDGPTITLGVTERRASDPAHSLGVLFFNPGGPGDGTREIVGADAAQYFPKAILRRFDIVGVDPRGVSPTHPAVSCGLPTRSRSVSETPTTQTGYERLLAYDQRVAHACLTRSGGLLGYVDTVSNARDLEAVRVALGARRVSWFGLSYGSLLGATYAHLFPNHIRAAVLDGALDHTVGSTRLALDEARSTEAEFDQFAHWCDTNPRCALHGRSVDSTYRSLLARARRHPIPTKGVRGGVTADQIGFGTYGVLLLRKHWPLLAAAIRAAVAPHPNAALFAKAGVPENAAYRVTTCEDFPTDLDSYPRFHALLTELWQVAPVTGPYVEGWDIDTGCMRWPTRARNPWGPVPVSGTPPLLVVGGAHDPATPEIWARGLARQIRSSRLLLWNGSGHTGYLNNPNVRTLEVDYLLSPNSPIPGTISPRSPARLSSGR